MFSSVNNLQIADVVRRAVFLLFLQCFQPVVCLFLLRKTSEIFHHFSLLYPPAAQAWCINYRVFRTKRTFAYYDRISKHLQKSLQRQLFKDPDRRSPNWANKAAFLGQVSDGLISLPLIMGIAIFLGGRKFFERVRFWTI